MPFELTPEEIRRLEDALKRATPTPWVFEMVEPAEIKASAEPGAAPWVPAAGLHSVIDWSSADRDLVHRALRALPELLKLAKERT